MVLVHKHVSEPLALNALERVAPPVVLLLLQSLLYGIPPVHKLVKLAFNGLLRWQLVRHIELDQLVAQDRHLRRLTLLKFNCDRLTCILPFARGVFKVPVR